MNPLLEKQLCQKYPKIFAKRNMSPQESCMHWGLECSDGWFSIIDSLCYRIQYHIDNPPHLPKKGCGKFVDNIKQLWNFTVWNKFVYPLIKDLPYEKYKKHSSRWQCVSYSHETASEGYIPQLVFEQVKEKFSGLRIYSSGGDEYTSALISFAEDIAYKTCEVCGRMDNTVGRNKHGWIKTTCIEHTMDVDDFTYNDLEVHNIFESIKK